jgi:hypothetical protein
MVAAALTIWLLFSFWIIVPIAGIPPRMGTVAMTLLAIELCCVLAWSYGVESCEARTCAPLGQAAGIAARTDLPALAAAFLVLALVRLYRLRRAPAVTARDGAVCEGVGNVVRTPQRQDR